MTTPLKTRRPDSAAMVSDYQSGLTRHQVARKHQIRVTVVADALRAAGVSARPAAEERFQARVNHNGPVPDLRPELGPCHVWTGFLHDGYGRFWFDGRNWPAHRWLLEQSTGPLPEGHEPDHLCRNRACVRLSHLEVVTQAENVRRAGPFRRGRAVGNAALEAAKTHCPQGHPYDDENTRVKNGRRHCRACGRARYHERKASR